MLISVDSLECSVQCSNSCMGWQEELNVMSQHVGAGAGARLGEIVWAKMGRDPWWPAQVSRHVVSHAF